MKGQCQLARHCLYTCCICRVCAARRGPFAMHRGLDQYEVWTRAGSDLRDLRFRRAVHARVKMSDMKVTDNKTSFADVLRNAGNWQAPAPDGQWTLIQ